MVALATRPVERGSHDRVRRNNLTHACSQGVLFRVRHPVLESNFAGMLDFVLSWTCSRSQVPPTAAADLPTC